MESLTSVLEAADPGPVEAAIFGTADATAVARVMASLASTATGVGVRAGRWYRSSVAAVAGLVLENGREVVVHAYQRSVGEEFLDGVVRVQEHLEASGFPCPRPLGTPLVVDGVRGRVESVLADPGPRRFGPSEMAASASGLARLVELAARVDPAGLAAHPMVLSDWALYPQPHSPLFDFEATASGAEWIDEIATAARSAMAESDPVIAHGDWSARNVRLGPAGLVGVYDWESLQHAPESFALGVAAATWPSLGEPGEPLAPTAREIVRYIDLYERERTRPFSAEQRRSACAAAVFALAYTARCEHALDSGTRHARASGRLASDDDLLSLLG